MGYFSTRGIHRVTVVRRCAFIKIDGCFAVDSQPDKESQSGNPSGIGDTLSWAHNFHLRFLRLFTQFGRFCFNPNLKFAGRRAGRQFQTLATGLACAMMAFPFSVFLEVLAP